MVINITFRCVPASKPQSTFYGYTFNSRYGSHRAEISLTSDGTYSIRIDGQINSSYEASAKRNPYYKIGMSTVAKEMLTRYANTDSAFRNIVKNTPQLAIGSFKEKEMTDLVKKTRSDFEAEADKNISGPDYSHLKLTRYSKKAYQGTKPTKAQVEENLREEANHKFFSLFKNRSSEKNEFVENNVEAVYQDRWAKYNELKQYFDNIQDVIASKVDAKNVSEYNSQKSRILADYKRKRDAYILDRVAKRKNAEDFLNGPVDYVVSGIKELQSKITFPFDADMLVNYQQMEGSMDVQVSIPSIIMIPETKATLLASGRISVKNKLQREKSQDLVLCQLGLAYYLCGSLFNVSANIKKICFSLIQRESGNGIYWVQFQRNQFFQVDFHSIDPLLIMEHYPHVFKYGKIELEPIPTADFKAKINDALLIAGQASNANQTVISVSDARRILDAMPNAFDLRKSYEDALTKGNSVLVTEKKYENILKEL